MTPFHVGAMVTVRGGTGQIFTIESIDHDEHTAVLSDGGSYLFSSLVLDEAPQPQGEPATDPSADAAPASAEAQELQSDEIVLALVAGQILAADRDGTLTVLGGVNLAQEVLGEIRARRASDEPARI